jgi:hypothetical protein
VEVTLPCAGADSAGVHESALHEGAALHAPLAWHVAVAPALSV